ncbi:MAG: hypothetical protein ACK463_26795, partial [Bradyrhizobium sp.]
LCCTELRGFVDGAPEAGGIDLQVGGGSAHVVSPFQLSFRGGLKSRTRNLEIPGSMLTHRPGMTF